MLARLSFLFLFAAALLPLGGCSGDGPNPASTPEKETPPLAKTQLTTGPWEWKITRCELADSYEVKSSNPMTEGTKITPKEKEGTLAVVHLSFQPLRDYTEEELAAIKKVPPGDVAFNFADVFKVRRFLMSGSLLLAHRKPGNPQDKVLVLSQCAWMLAEKGSSKKFGGMSIAPKEASAPTSHILYADEEPLEIVAVFPMPKEEASPVICFLPFTKEGEMGNALLKKEGTGFVAADYGEGKDISKWLPDWKSLPIEAGGKK